MLQEGFKQKTLGHNGYIYMQVLKENILKELGIDKPLEQDDLLYENMIKVNENDARSPEAVLQGKYNTAKVNNLEALGYDNIKERLES